MRLSEGIDVAAPLAGGVDGAVETGFEVVVAEPGGELAEGGAVGVVEVVAGGDDLNGACAGTLDAVEQAGVETEREKEVGGKAEVHSHSRYNMGGRTEVCSCLRSSGLGWCWTGAESGTPTPQDFAGAAMH